MPTKKIIEELKKEQLKYSELHKSVKGNILDDLKADAFRLAIQKLESHGLEETYSFFKDKIDDYAESQNRLTRNVVHAYRLVLGKLWKYYNATNKKSSNLCKG